MLGTKCRLTRKDEGAAAGQQRSRRRRRRAGGGQGAVLRRRVCQFSISCLAGWRRGEVPWHTCLAVTTVLLIVLFSYILLTVQQIADLVDGAGVFMKILQAQISIGLLVT